jgi:uncharacterized protein YndB with AHSA1/START domain
MFRNLNIEVFYPYPPQRVWQVITNRRALAAWLMENDFEPRVGHKFRFQQSQFEQGINSPANDSSILPGLNESIDCEVIELDEPKRLAYTWRDKLMHQPSIVTWTLDAVDGGTRLQLKHQVLQHQSVETFRGKTGKTFEEINLSQPWQGNLKHQPNASIKMLEPFTRNTQFQPAYKEFEVSNSIILNTFLNGKWKHLLNNKLQQILANDELLVSHS